MAVVVVVAFRARPIVHKHISVDHHHAPLDFNSIKLALLVGGDATDDGLNDKAFKSHNGSDPPTVGTFQSRKMSPILTRAQ